MYIVYIKIHIDENTLSLIKSPLASDFKPIEAKLKQTKKNQPTNQLSLFHGNLKYLLQIGRIESLGESIIN